MTSMTPPVIVVAVSMVFGHAAAGRSQGNDRSWLDQAKPAAWNKPGTPVPVGPKVEVAADPRCREAARPPQLNEDKRVNEQGWDLVGAFQGGWEMVVIRGTAGYDGMCRPRQYQDFVFVRGAFAGTLSPQPMDSRTDGALQRVTLQSATRMTVEYARYSATDPLCCPSRTTRVVFDLAADGIVRPVSAATAKP